MVRQRIYQILVLLACLFSLSVSTAVSQGALQVTASYSILADVVRNVAGDLVEVSTFIPVGGDPHAFIPTPSDLTAIADADIVFRVGAGHDEALLKAIAGSGEAAGLITCRPASR